MRVRLVCVGEPGIMLGSPDSAVGQWLKSYDPDARDGYGEAHWTSIKSEAMVFVDNEAALRCYVQQSRTRPLREDGRPNKPLTAYSVGTDPVEEDL